ncbi:hypothetical protein [Citricoccus sp. NR2]|uniref:hypothetical protein n=1 Tax=Citricoccus sp. NR2 TaxID=3004095 RepID=UPI0022DD613C|nr:hypothetical protein [Citricoccus sp. NR2]WBL20382.1 hypothetical protein O1A05_06795 [Citricoccus sp. NR2]
MTGDTTAPALGQDATRPGGSRRRWGWICAGAAGVTLIAGAVTVAVLNSTVFTPEAVVERYLDAVREGDGATAFGLAQARFADAEAPGENPDGLSTALLDGEALASTLTGVEDLQVTEVSADESDLAGTDEADDADAVVRVSFTVDGAEHHSDFGVNRTGRDWLVFPRWSMQEVALQEVVLEPSGLPENAAADAPVADVNEVPVPLTGRDAESQSRFAVLPPAVVTAEYEGSFVASVSPGRAIVENTGAAAGEDAEQAHRLELTLGATEALTAEIQRQISEHLTFCTDQKVLQPTGCPMRYWTSNRVTPDSIEWSIPEDPKIYLEHENDASQIRIAGVDAVARITLEEIDLVTGEARTVEEDLPFELQAELTVTPERVVVRPDLS